MKIALLSTLTFAAMALLAGCGKAKPMPEFGTAAQVVFPADGSNIMGKYKGEFITLNTNINGFITPTASILRKDEKFQVSLKLPKGDPYVWHKQAITIGWRCPMEVDDLNKDGLIDIVEAEKVWGKTIIPLDGDISSQAAGNDKYPVGGDSGEYSYKRSANFDELFGDLSGEIPAEGEFTKLAGMGLGLEGNVIMILGSHEGAALPDTVASKDGLPAYKTFPLACGLIRKVSDEAGDVDMESNGNLGGVEDAPRRPVRTPAEEEEVEPAPPTVEAEAPEESPAPRPRTRPSSDDGDSEDWDDRIRRWWRRTFSGGGRN